MRPRGVLLFAAGVIVGAFLFYTVAWRTGGLAPGHWLTRGSRDLVAGQPAAPRPIPTFPFPTPTPTTTPVSSLPASGLAPAVLTNQPVGASILARGFAGPQIVPLLVPVAGVHISALHDNFDEARGRSRRHDAIDILAPRGAPVLAAVDGTVAKLFTSQQGGLTVYEFDRAGAYCYYYAHLDRYASGLVEGMALKRGDRIGDVGTTGNAPRDTPHLHFAMFRLGPDKHWWQGEAVNPFPLLQKAEER